MRGRQLWSLLIILVLHACSYEDKFEVGEVKNGVYHNDFFSIDFTIPEGWTSGTRDEVNTFLEIGAESLGKLDDSIAAVIDTNDFSEAILFIMTKHPEKEVEENRSVGIPSSMIMSCERVKKNSQFSKSEDYLLNLKKEYQAINQIKMRFDDSYADIAVGTKQFKVLKGKASLGFIELNQEYWCAIDKNYALVVILTYTDPFDRIEMYNALKNMHSK